MDVELFRELCLKKPCVTESLPFGDSTLVFKLAGKMFALLSLEGNSCNLKCDPEKSESLRTDYHGIKPGYHMSKKHWNTILFDTDVTDRLIEELLEDSFQLVLKGLPKYKQREIAQ